ncbi:PQQ-dependent sugar dehydrogenase [Aequorivita marina]|uniref:PQQ-dependent sugar dehydrogenase n=1 Tax=Aequorivita marina TaxID=3073654 RepID=UPI002876AC54|nr:PQQ-dependent sugar dehydrogenase [Aequorivita sp. S2608]MDS1298787.1 PQQ-dependent sugar dehydrogenase [Aequorivita sp. S2608]
MRKSILLILLLIIPWITSAQEVDLELFKDGFSQPLSLQHANDDRLFIVEQGGKIKIIQADGSVNPVPFLDVSDQISTGGERGLLGLAFHPDYENNGYFFVNYTRPNGDTQISRFSVDPDTPDVAHISSELPILGYEQPFSNHNGGNLAFGPEGFLYISSGDGGGNPGNRAQDLNLLLGKILRIDVDNPTGGNNYGIPATNPFVDDPNARDEIWAYGLRNPWRFSFDFEENNTWIADVGQSEIEEINRAPISEGGLNYGWPCYEGSQPFNTQNCPPQSELTFPYAEYSHTNGKCSITGGYVYRGDVELDLEGHYIFADFCSGEIGIIEEDGAITFNNNFSGSWVSFGEDTNKELYIIDLDGAIYKILAFVIGTEDFSIENSLYMTPNPTSGNVLFSLKDDKLQTISLFDISGSFISSEENIFKNNYKVSTESLSPGIYFAKIISEKGASTVKKLIVQ